MNLAESTSSDEVTSSMSDMHNTNYTIDVWQHNLVEEMHNIIELSTRYKVISMDTEFPGVVVNQATDQNSVYRSGYSMMRDNVNLLKMIQLGICFTDEYGNVPDDGHCGCWQFHFKFDLEKDLFCTDSIQLLIDSGMDFERHREEGIDPLFFGELLISSGMVFNDQLKWLAFHGGYDFGYLLKMIINCELPQDERMFFGLLNMHFPNIMDLKCMMRCIAGLRGGLNQLASDLGINRLGSAHQAGSDCLLTSACYNRMMNVLYEYDLSEYNGILYGLGSDAYYLDSCYQPSSPLWSPSTSPTPSSCNSPVETNVDTPNWPEFKYASTSQKHRKKRSKQRKHQTSNRSCIPSHHTNRSHNVIVNKCN
jgi:CCR4-NOT transcription complex subunit 7/8